MTDILIDVWLYGDLARYGGRADHGSFANPKVRLPDGSTLRDLLKHLRMPTEERGITFINGELSAMPDMCAPTTAMAISPGKGAGLSGASGGCGRPSAPSGSFVSA